MADASNIGVPESSSSTSATARNFDWRDFLSAHFYHKNKRCLGVFLRYLEKFLGYFETFLIISEEIFRRFNVIFVERPGYRGSLVQHWTNFCTETESSGCLCKSRPMNLKLKIWFFSEAGISKPLPDQPQK